MSKTTIKPADISAMIENSSAATMEPVERTLERLLEIGSVKSVYADPVQHGDKMVIPAAEVLGALGFGMGIGMGAGESSDKKGGEEEGEGVEDKGKPAAATPSGPAAKVEGEGGGGGWRRLCGRG